LDCHGNKAVSKETLDLLGVLSWNIAADTYKEDGKLDQICKERDYKNRDEVKISDQMPNLEEKLKMFFTEHLHDDEEIRYVLEGSGYFDVRDENNDWIRIHVFKNDMIVLPAGMYHRFTVDATRLIHVIRLFKDEPKWTAYPRNDPGTDAKPSRKDYTNYLTSKSHATKSVNGTPYILTEGAKSIANYPHMRETNGMLYVSGLSSRRPDNTHEGATKNADGTWTLNIEAQTKAVIENLRTVLRLAGADLEHLVDCTVFLVDMKDYTGMNVVYNTYFNKNTGPTRTTIAVKELPHPNLLIEIKAVAVAPNHVKLP